MEGGKTKEQLLQELIRLHREMEKRMETQERFVSEFQFLVWREGLLSKSIDSLPFPLAVFERSGVVLAASGLLAKLAGIRENDLAVRKVNLLDRVTNENYGIFEAAEDVFAGETTLVENLNLPLGLFCGDETFSVPDPYRTAVFFPVHGAGGARCGAVVLMR